MRERGSCIYKSLEVSKDNQWSVNNACYTSFDFYSELNRLEYFH